MSIREFWHDIRERFRDDDSRERWESAQRGHPQREWRNTPEYRDNDRDAYAREYDRTGPDRHYSARAFTPMGVHGREDTQQRPQEWSAGDERAHFGESDMRHQYSEGRWDVYSNELGQQSQWPDRYASPSELRDHRGRGPANWQRSDARLYEEVCECLMEDHDLDASEIEVRVDNGVVTLSGTVESRGNKRHAEALVERIRGVSDVHNQLRVQRASDTFLGTHDALRDSSIGH